MNEAIRKTKNDFTYQPVYIKTLVTLEKIIFNLDEENIDLAVQQTIKLYDSYPYSFNNVINNLIYFAFCSRKTIIEIYLKYLETIQTKENEITKSNIQNILFFINYVSKINSQESHYLIDKMIKLNIIKGNITENIPSYYFAHYKTKKENINDQFSQYFTENYDDLSKNDWELHKQLIENGVNPNKISSIIRNDNIKKLQEISSQNDFDFNKKIEPSLYERCSFINEENVTLIDYAAFFSSVKCFKYLLMNGAKVVNTAKFAIAGGNAEIIYLCEQYHSSFEGAYESAIEFHRNDIFKYIYENRIKKIG